MSNPSSRGWGPGWPTSRLADQVPLEYITGRIHKDIHDLIFMLCRETENRGYNIRKDWSWGYASRPIGNGNRPSFHSWGLAIDINAPTNPMRRPLTTDMPGWMPEMWKSFGFRWGGDYRTTPDAMHYEFMGTPADAVKYTREAEQKFQSSVSTPVVDRPANKNNAERMVESMERLSLSNQSSPSGSRAGWRRAQSLLAAAGNPPRNTFNASNIPDGIPGGGTRDALGRFQRRNRTGHVNSPDVPDFIIGNGTWSALMGI